MDLDKELIRVVLRDGESAFRSALDRGIVAERLYDDGKIAWNFIVEHKKQYGVLPSLPLILGSCVNTKGEQLDLSAGLFDSTNALIDKVLERSTLNLLLDGTKKVHAEIAKRDAKAATEAFEEIHRKLLRENLTVSKVETLFSLGTKVIEQYDFGKAGGMGIPAPWPTMTAQTMGWWPEDLVLIVGRSGVGKSWTLCLLAHAAWFGNHKVLFCTTEMPREQIAARFLCMHLKIPYTDFRKYKLGDYVEKRLKDGIIALMADQGIDMVGKGFDFTIDNLEAAIEDSKPTLLIVDGAYLIKNIGKDRQEKVANTFNDFKRMGIKHHIAVATSTQFNRQAKNGQEETVIIENVGITDVAGWNASAAFGLYQTPDMYRERIMGVKPLKIREGEPIAFQCHWDLTRMDFSEVGGSAQTDNPATPIVSPVINSQSDSDDTDVPF